jgi:hypothetical protein
VLAFDWKFFLVKCDIICTQWDGVHENEIFLRPVLEVEVENVVSHLKVEMFGRYQ